MTVTPRYEKRSQLQGKRRGVGHSQAKMRGASELPENPTGRHVVISNDGIKNGGTQTTHWCPDATKTGEYAWKCPDCGAWFNWSVDEKQWKPAR